MGRYRSRSRSRSYSPRGRSRTPPRRRHYDEPRSSRSHRDRRSPLPSGLLVRNIALDARPEDLRVPFERFGPVKDVYLPKNYYTGDPRGFGFVKFRNGEDAAEAKRQLNHTVIGGREIAIVFAEENRKTPQEMRKTPHESSRSGGSYRRRTPPRSSRRRHPSYSPSPSSSPVRHRSRDRRTRGHRSRSRSRSMSRSLSPRDDKAYESNHKSPSPSRKEKDPSPHAKRDIGSDQRLESPRETDESPPYKRDNGIEQRSPNPRREKDRVLSRSPSHSRSPRPRSRRSCSYSPR